MPESTHRTWLERFSLVYGELGGQRAVRAHDLQRALGSSLGRDTDAHQTIFGLQTYFVLVADLLAAASLTPDPRTYLADLAALDDHGLTRALHRVSSGLAVEEFGVVGGSESFEFGWYVEALDSRALSAIRDLLRGAGDAHFMWDRSIRPLDFLGDLYISLMPRNLLHVLGEVYTPAWLAVRLVSESGWKTGSTLTDPYAGSGVFLLAALTLALQVGADPLEALACLMAVDLNPVACAAARANLILLLAGEIRRSRVPVRIPVRCADSMEPAIPPISKQQLPLWSASSGKQPDLTTGRRSTVSAGRSVLSSDADPISLSPLEPTLTQSDVLATNPPWVGWEYMSRPYRARLEPAWQTYDLYLARGRDAAFLKEDVSTLALVVAWDRYLRDHGTCVAVVRPATMTSSMAARGIRRLSINGHTPMALMGVNLFDGVRVFPYSQASAATWHLKKGEETVWPVPVTQWKRSVRRWQPTMETGTAEIREKIVARQLAAERVTPSDITSRWMIGPNSCVEAATLLRGENAYKARTGIFTGGANAVYYVQPDSDPTNGVGCYRNVNARARRETPSVSVRLESDLVFRVVRGRDIRRWYAEPGGWILCPHTANTRMHAVPPKELAAKHPLAFAYLTTMRPILDSRGGFSGWETAFRDKAFYAIQRVGAYTFSPFKVAWRYIADDFIVAIVGPDEQGRPRLVNDKVMFVAVQTWDEAAYLAGVLTSDPLRWMVTAFATGTQISVEAIRPLRVGRFNADDPRHRAIATACSDGHAAVRAGNYAGAQQCLVAINENVASLFGLSGTAMLSFAAELKLRHSEHSFSVRPKGR